MKVKELIDLISDEKVIIAHGWEYYRNRLTDEVKSFYVDEIPDHILAMEVCCVSGYLYDSIQIRLKSSKSLYFPLEYCSCYKSVEKWINDNYKVVSEWRKEIKNRGLYEKK